MYTQKVVEKTYIGEVYIHWPVPVTELTVRVQRGRGRLSASRHADNIHKGVSTSVLSRPRKKL